MSRTVYIDPEYTSEIPMFTVLGPLNVKKIVPIIQDWLERNLPQGGYEISSDNLRDGNPLFLQFDSSVTANTFRTEMPNVVMQVVPDHLVKDLSWRPMVNEV
ncbi:MAG: hypothetical protein EOP84_01690 [Verrucomicrobiaceae bacterium]|nr:MAG: hypothetical protein EOP84_01690 [Verrucomicrobiaceae bacterium]